MFLHLQYTPSEGFSVDLQSGVQSLISFDLGEGKSLRLLGDPVFRPDPGLAGRLIRPNGEPDLTALYSEIRGHYYWILQTATEVRLGTSFCSIYPLYYHAAGGQIQVSSSAFFLAGQTDPGQPNRRYLLERLLFNYPFFQQTLWTGIHLLPTHGALRISDAGMQVEKPFSIEDHFGEGRKGKPEHMEQLCAAFGEECRLFLPEGPFALSFTGGFDGRTLLAAARKEGRSDFLTYSFGMPGEEDVSFPLAQAKKLGIPYQPIYLDERYVAQHAFHSALAFLELSEYNGNLGRPHYHYAAQVLSEKVPCILTGNFGSELFRAMHQPGVMMSEALIRIFSAQDGSWKDYLLQQAGPAFRTEAEALAADIDTWLAEGSGLTPNQRFYRFVLEEIFRKYFGPELIMQSHLLRNRTPYLSLRFFKALNDTIWSGVHADLFEKQKSKRMKGQQFYAAYLRQTDPELYRMPTNKGYSPADVLEAWRLPLLVARVARKKFLRREMDDSNAVGAYFQRYRDQLAAHFRLDEQPETLQTDTPDFERKIHTYTVAAAWMKGRQIYKPNGSIELV